MSDISTQCANWAPTWAHLRDHAKPVVPDDVGQLAEVREQTPPSKAHVKRLTRLRPVVGRVQKFLEVGDDPTAARAAHNATIAKAHAMLAKHGLATKPYVAHPLPPKPAPVVVPEPPRAHPLEQARDYRVERAHMIAMAKMVHRDFQPDDARIMRVFGSHEAWERAKRSA